MHIVDLDKRCFLVKFAMEQDYFKALTGGPWILLDHYKMVAWVRFPHPPIHFYHAQVHTSLGNLVGKTIRIYFNTQTSEHGKFARIAIEIDLDTSPSHLLFCWMELSNKLSTRTFPTYAFSVVVWATRRTAARGCP
ncbi:hypothetical protein LINPERHAP1_LOCUS136 [Linum perenne]